MWDGEFTLSEFLSMLEDKLYRNHISNKWRASERRVKKHNVESARKYQHNRIGWGERRRKVESEDVEIRRLREY
jgi:hypothetical protein